MKFFTPDLLDQFGSENDDVAHAAEEELEQRSDAYVRHLGEIEDRLPQRFRDLIDHFYLHDARVISQQSVMVTDLEWLEHELRLGKPPRDKDKVSDGSANRRTFPDGRARSGRSRSRT